MEKSTLWSLNRKEDLYIKPEELPSHFRLSSIPNAYIYNTFIRVGNPKYSKSIEDNVRNHICRVLKHDNVIDKVTLIRGDGTVWTIHISSLESWQLIQFNH